MGFRVRRLALGVWGPAGWRCQPRRARRCGRRRIFGPASPARSALGRAAKRPVNAAGAARRSGGGREAGGSGDGRARRARVDSVGVPVGHTCHPAERLEKVRGRRQVAAGGRPGARSAVRWFLTSPHVVVRHGSDHDSARSPWRKKIHLLPVATYTRAQWPGDAPGSQLGTRAGAGEVLASRIMRHLLANAGVRNHLGRSNSRACPKKSTSLR
jgi:hypothetical protein